MISTPVLTECCQRKTACRLVLVHSGVFYPALLSAIVPQGIEIRLRPDDDGDPPLPQAICCISFPYKASFCAFLGCLTEVEATTSDELRVVATVPSELTSTNLRQSFRVPVVMQAGLRAIIHTDDRQKFEVQVRDIAESGLEIELNQEQQQVLSVDISVIVELRYQDEVVRRKAQVRRVGAARCGLMLFEPASDDEHRQAAAMHGMVLSLQQQYLKNRITG